MTGFATREGWLEAALDRFRPWFDEQDAKWPALVRVSVSFPSSGWKGRAIGECHYAAKDGVPQLMIHPALDNPVDVLATLLHEQVHATLGFGAQHGPPFRKLAVALGLTGRMTSTVPTDELRWSLGGIAKHLGPYPHSKLAGGGRIKPPQGTRMIKVACLNAGCDSFDDSKEAGYTIRTVRKWLDDFGTPVCPACSQEMEEA